MLVRFVVSNYLSFGAETEFNMLTGAPRRFREHVYKFGDLELLKTAAIYGPNGAGKSNLVRAILLLKEVVTGEDGVDQYAFEPFRLAPGMEQQPTQLEAEFIAAGIVYSYGISVFQGKITEEWLYRSGRKDELVFQRTLSGGKTRIEASPTLCSTAEDELRFKLYEEELLPDNRSLLGMLAGAKRVFTDIENAFGWFSDNLTIIDPGSKVHGLPLQYLVAPLFKNFVDELLPSLKTGIARLEMETIGIDQYFGVDDSEQSEDIKRRLLSGSKEYDVIYEPGSEHIAVAVREGEKVVVKRLVAVHEDKDSKVFRFELHEESDGTRRILDFAPALFEIIFSEKTVVIDEMDQSIHPHLLKELIAKFVQDSRTKGQLIFTTHESNLLDQEIFRQDEIWFAEKKATGETTFYPLSYYDIRHDLDIRKGYLNGRFGAIPVLGNLKDLKWEQYAEEEPVV